MRSQIEGSQAVAGCGASAVRSHLGVPDLPADPYRRGALGSRARTGELAPCEYLMVESEFAALSAAIGASAAGARTYTATASRNTLYMAEALYNASGLGLPIMGQSRTARSARRSTFGTTTRT